jgi:hypothetical protein
LSKLSTVWPLNVGKKDAQKPFISFNSFDVLSRGKLEREQKVLHMRIANRSLKLGKLPSSRQVVYFFRLLQSSSNFFCNSSIIETLKFHLNSNETSSNLLTPNPIQLKPPTISIETFTGKPFPGHSNTLISPFRFISVKNNSASD